MSDRLIVEPVVAEDVDVKAQPPPPWVLVVALVALIAGWSVVSGVTGTGGVSVDIEAPFEPFAQPAGIWVEHPFSDVGGFTDVAHGEAGLVVVGTGRRIDSPPFAYHSADGEAWTEVVAPWVSGEALTSVIAAGNGYLAAGYRPRGQVSESFEATVPVVWTSDDGVTWARVETAGLSGAGIISRLSIDDSTITAVGWSGPARLEPTSPPLEGTEPHIWTSRDGIIWEDETPPGQPLWFTDMATHDGATAISGASDRGAALWIRQGDTWVETVAPDVSSLLQVAIAVTDTGDGFLVIARPYYDFQGVPSLWLVGVDGEWTRLVGSNRPMAAGWSEATSRGTFAGPAFTRSNVPSGPEIWVSEDGVDWTGVEVTTGPTPWPPTLVTYVTVFEGRLMAFGSRGGLAASWQLMESGVEDPPG